MSAIAIVTGGVKAPSGTGGAVDVSAKHTLRLIWRVLTTRGLEPYIRLFVDTAPTANGPWTVMHEKYIKSNEPSYSAAAWNNGEVRVQLAGHDSFVRGRWAGAAGGAVDPVAGDPVGDPEFNIELAGDAKPDA